MLRVIFDTNVFVSALITPRGKTASLFFYADKFKFIVSLELLKEITETFAHPHIADKYGVTRTMVRGMLFHLKQHAIVVVPKKKLNLVSGAMDNHILALAKESHADFLVTGDREVLNLKKIGVTSIISPGEFLKQIGK